ncbi:MAG TPA: YvcK family protein [Candidatus Avidesulfovibrio excrementigallinarum]|nr:YvcK family protein [Candidatus Avidesulfovibrio excrementigallinarum]
MRARPLLFFSGGSALKEVSASLAAQGESAVYLMTPFDSGGSSAVLRHAFAMPAVGDIRSRLLALSGLDAPCVALLNFRLPDDEDAARAALTALTEGRHPLWQSVSQPVFRRRVLDELRRFAAFMPAAMPRSRACVGNLLLAGLYLRHGRSLNAATSLFARLVRARGIVHAVADANAELWVRLADGTTLCGQHRFTGKFFPPVCSPIQAIGLSQPVAASPAALRWIRRARLVCYPPGSFFSSILATLLPEGIREALATVDCPHVFVPNPLPDPELQGHTLADQLRILSRHAPLTHLLLDTATSRYAGPVPLDWLHSHHVRLIVCPLLHPDGRLSPALLADALGRVRL